MRATRDLSCGDSAQDGRHLDYRASDLVLLCRFSDAGDSDLTTRSDGRRPKSAKARNRVGREETGGAAGARRRKRAMGI